MRRRAAALMALAGLAAGLGPGACSKPPAVARGLSSDALDAAIGPAIGDPTTCVILADPASGRIVYRYGQLFNCERPLPACDRPGTLTANTALRLARSAGGRDASCASTADGSRSVGWAEGRTKDTQRDLLYSAVMEGQRALPGHEMAARLADAFQQAGV
jgi:hypothetical protein